MNRESGFGDNVKANSQDKEVKGKASSTGMFAPQAVVRDPDAGWGLPAASCGGVTHSV